MSNRNKGSLIYSAVGDSLGWITEFLKNVDELEKRHGIKKVTSFLDWNKKVGGPYYGYIDSIKAGSYSDDTQLMLCVARSIRKEGVDIQYFSKSELANWIAYSRGGGITIKNAAKKIKRKNASWNNNFFTYKAGKMNMDYRDSGANGAAMRILPIALAYNNEQKILQNIFSNSIVTHGHPTAIIGALIYGLAIIEVKKLNIENFNTLEYLENLGVSYKEMVTSDIYKNTDYTLWLEKWNIGKNVIFEEEFNKSFRLGLDGLRELYNSLKREDEAKDVLKKLGCFENETKGSGIATVLAGIYIFLLHHKDPIDGILCSANMIGTDSDSIAAFCGGLTGYLHGAESIPEEFKQLQDYSYIYDLGQDLDKFDYSNRENNIHNNKEINDIDSDIFSEYDIVNFHPLGDGEIISIDRQDTVVEGKYNLIIEVKFDCGQTCFFSKVLNKKI